MKYNHSMETLLKVHGITIEDVPAENGYPIWMKHDPSGRPYWGTADFCGIENADIPRDINLSELEWDGNELMFDAYSYEGIAEILKKAIGVIKAWKTELEEEYPDNEFGILASFDSGEHLINKEDFPNGNYSVTMRFWAERKVPSFTDGFEDWEQPTIIETCNISGETIMGNKAKKAPLHSWKQAQKSRFLLTREEVESLFDFLETALENDGCDNSLKHTKQWLMDNHKNEDDVIKEIHEMGGFCDCEVLLNCYEDYDLD